MGMAKNKLWYKYIKDDVLNTKQSYKGYKYFSKIKFQCD